MPSRLSREVAFLTVLAVFKKMKKADVLECGSSGTDARHSCFSGVASHLPYCRCLQTPATRCNGCRAGRYVHLSSRGGEKMLWGRWKYTQETDQGCLSPVEELYTLWVFFAKRRSVFAHLIYWNGLVCYNPFSLPVGCQNFQICSLGKEKGSQ